MPSASHDTTPTRTMGKTGAGQVVPDKDAASRPTTPGALVLKSTMKTVNYKNEAFVPPLSYTFNTRQLDPLGHRALYPSAKRSMAARITEKYFRDFKEDFDEDAAYKEMYPKRPDRQYWVDLCEKTDDERYTTNESVSHLYNNKPSGYSLSAERLVWLNGYRGTDSAGMTDKAKDQMTLVLLKLVFKSRYPKGRIDYAAIQIRFQSHEKTGKDPEVVAWGPFHDTEEWNQSTTQRRTDAKTEIKAGGGGGLGFEVSAGFGRENEARWEQTFFDQGSSCELYGDKRIRHGVAWRMEQNPSSDKGIMPEIRVGLLLRRPQLNDPYLVTLKVDAGTGVIAEAADECMRLVGIDPGDRVIWRADPCVTAACDDEGFPIAQKIDSNNLGALLDAQNSTNLSHSWLNPREALQAKTESKLKADMEPTTTIIPEVVSSKSGSGDEANHDEKPRQSPKSANVPASVSDGTARNSEVDTPPHWAPVRGRPTRINPPSSTC